MSRFMVSFQVGQDKRYGVAGEKIGEYTNVEDVLLPKVYKLKDADLTDVNYEEVDKYLAAELAQARKLMAQNPRDRVCANDLFNMPVADGNAYYVVTSVKKTVCSVEWRGYGNLDRYADHYFGFGGSFPLKKVQHYVLYEKHAQKVIESGDKYYNSLKDGDIVHYGNGRKEFVRCEVVTKDGEKALKAIALVGEWQQYDLPSRQKDGNVYVPHHAKMVLEGGTMQPHHSNIVESGWGSQIKHDLALIRSLPAIDLTVPPMTPEEKKEAGYYNFGLAASNMLNHGGDEKIEDVKQRLEEALKILQEALK